MNETNAQRVITFRDIWELFLQRLVIVLLVTALSVGIFYLYTQATYTEMYQSTATLYITGDKSIEDGSSADAYNNYSLSLKVISDCDYILSSRAVVEQVIENNEKLSYLDYNVLQSRISTENPLNTRVLEVTVEAESPELAKHTVDALCEVGVIAINNAMAGVIATNNDMKVENYVSLYDQGTLSDVPCNGTSNVTYLVVGLIAAALTFAVCLLVFLVDDRIHTADHIEQVLGLSVLGDIPNANASGAKGRYGYYRGKAYGPYGRPYGPYGKPYGAYGHSQKSNQKPNQKGRG